MSARPDRRFGVEVARAAAPVVAGVALAAGVPWLQRPEQAAIVVLGLVVGAAVARADARAPLRAWRRRYPSVSFDRVRRVPRDRAGVEALGRLCTAATALEVELAQLPRGLRARLRRQVADLVLLGATLTVRRERLLGETAPALQDLRRGLERQIEALVPEALRLRATVARTAAPPLTEGPALAAVRRVESELRAAADVEDELRALEAGPWSVRAS